jgi:predicted Zn-dependent protease
MSLNRRRLRILGTEEAVDRLTLRLPLAALVALGCAINPVSRRPELVLTTTAAEREAGARETENLARQVGFVRDPELVAYVEEIARRLAAHSPRQDVAVEIHIIDMSEPNAFALPGGFVFVTRGLLALTNSEDELVGVIGHEIGHVAARHSVQRISAAAPLSIATGISAFALGILSPSLGRAVAGVGDAANELVLAPYSRSQEREADRVGQELAAKSGWDPAGISDFLNTLDRQAALQTGQTRRFHFLDSHPMTDERVEATRERAATLERGQSAPIAARRGDFLERLDGLVVGPDPAVGLLLGDRFLHPDLDIALRFPAGWRAANTPSFVGAQPETADAIALLEPAAEGNDALLAGERMQDRLGVPLRGPVRPVSHPTLRAARASGSVRGVEYTFTWLTHRGTVYLLTVACKQEAVARYREELQGIVESVRPLTAAERDEITALRIRIASPRSGESLRSLLRRSQSEWSLAEAAIANALEEDQSLESGELVKLPRREPYRGISR